MNLDTRLGQHLDVSQQLNLAPQLLQWLRLLQLPMTDLKTLVNQELEMNPTLELEESAPDIEASATGESAAETSAADLLEQAPTTFDEAHLDGKFEMLAEMDADWGQETPGGRLTSAEADNEKRQFMMDCITAQESLQDHLLAQLATVTLDAEDRRLTELLIGSLDERGYLTAAPDELAGAASCSAERLDAALRRVQALDPAGVGARDLRECLLLQMDDRASLTARIVRECFDALACKQYREIAAALGVEEEDVRDALREIRTLHPEPGRLYTAERVQYIKADATIRKTDAGYRVELNDERLPRLRINAECRRLLEAGKLSAEDTAYLRKKIRHSSFLIQGIKQRQDTLRKVAQEILRHQQAYFDAEDGQLKPLTMATVAQTINVHETTVSRALANKYIETPRGLFEMKHFFRSGYRCDDGSAVVPAAVKDLIETLVARENPALPLTDLQMVKAMKEKGLHLARRTVAKYREELGIASSKERQDLSRAKAAPVRRLAVPAAAPLLHAVG